MNNLLDAAQRRRQGLNPLTTTLTQPQQQLYTPNSSVSPSPSFGYQSYTPASAVQQYNPQQWRSGQLDARFSPPGTDDIQVPAPPPYSPPRSQRPATLTPEEPLSAVSPLQRQPIAFTQRPSPEPSQPPVFPPPPGTQNRTRAGSRDRPHFGLGGVFTRKNNASDAQAGETSRQSPDLMRDHASSSRRPAPLAIEPLVMDSVSWEDTRPPGSRRAASTGAIDTPSSSRSRGSSTSRGWEPGMPLPPPPPGPPPANSRSQSMTRTPSPVISPPTRRPPQQLSNLGPIPPTPAGWVEGDVMPHDAASRGRSPHLHIDTSSVASTVTNSSTAPESTSGSSSLGLARTGAVRGEKSLRERRSESRTGKAVATPDEPSNNPWAEAITPSDIVVPNTTLGRRQSIHRSTPRSGRYASDTPNSSKSLGNTPILSADVRESRGSTPRPSKSSSQLEGPTSPFFPDKYAALNRNESPMIPPKSLPTPPPQPHRPGSSPRPISHILHTPLQDTALPAPLSPARTTSQSSTSHVQEDFSQAANIRHEIFTRKEVAASTDEERVRLFAEFIVSESRLRREKYASAIDAMGLELLELTRDLFRPYTNSHRNSNTSFSSDRPSKSGNPSSARSTKTPALQIGSKSDSNPSSAGSMAASPGARPESSWWTGYMPSLSPIPSMSASIAPDGSSSRGRPSSRWWEVGQSNSGGSPTTKFERSKRESKYMGMPRELREQLQYEGIEDTSTPAAGPSGQKVHGPDEYPPEKVGWHEEGPDGPPTGKTPTSAFVPYSPAPTTPNPKHLDVSRLVTLPPPYPRHHPAVNNNHPDLTAIRTVVRALSDFTEVDAIKERFNTADGDVHEAAAESASKRRHDFRIHIQRQIEAGTMTYADAAVKEAEFATSEAEIAKASSKTSFEFFQTSVVTPLNDILMESVERATQLFEQLRSQLFVDAQQQQRDPNMTAEEGDEQPELLEKLTLLKWIFEAREQLHRALFELLSDRNDRYKDMVITPYRLAKNDEKIRNAEHFFADDARKRRLEFDQTSLQRTLEFMDVVETNVVRGVEVQLSAFWDIAPPLRQIIEKIPRNMTHDFRVQIPSDEYQENPGYYEHPLQYLYTLLEHAQKSTYQFIESQTNLLCLLHEVKFAVTAARTKVVETERLSAGEDEDVVKEEGKAKRLREERRLTDDLKEKVRTVEEQWETALGTELVAVKNRVRGVLMEVEGGWEGMDGE